MSEDRAAADDFRRRAARVDCRVRGSRRRGARMIPADVAARSSAPRASAFEGVTFYEWLVVIIASCGWLFDCMDQRIFILARTSALQELLRADPKALASLTAYAGYATTAMILGWATG